MNTTTLERLSTWEGTPTLAQTAHAARDLAVVTTTDAIHDWATLMLKEQVEQHCTEFGEATSNMNPEDETILHPLYLKIDRLSRDIAYEPRCLRHGALASLATVLDAAATYAARIGAAL